MLQVLVTSIGKMPIGEAELEPRIQANMKKVGPGRLTANDSESEGHCGRVWLPCQCSILLGWRPLPVGTALRMFNPPVQPLKAAWQLHLRLELLSLIVHGVHGTRTYGQNHVRSINCHLPSRLLRVIVGVDQHAQSIELERHNELVRLHTIKSYKQRHSGTSAFVVGVGTLVSKAH